MSSTFASLILSVLLILFTATTTTGQLLEAEYLDIKLPSANACPTPHYDGGDSIYLFGGCYPASDKDILKFSISSETLDNVGSLPSPSQLGTVQSDNSGNIFYFGGGGCRRDVYKFDPLSNTSTRVAMFPYDVYAHVSIKYDNTVLILGGWDQERELLSFDMATLNISTVSGNLPFSVVQGTSVRVGKKAYIFHNNENRMVAELDFDTFDMQLVGPPTLPNLYYYPSSVYDGNHVYVIGGYQNAQVDGLIQFNPRTKESNFILVRNFPVEQPEYFTISPASICVPSKNRVYFFGGASWFGIGDVIHDDIFYIDLTPLLEPTPSTELTYSNTNPDFFTCSNRPKGVYPHPTDCSQFIGCHDEEISFFSCQPPLLFDPETLCCDFSDTVNCST